MAQADIKARLAAEIASRLALRMKEEIEAGRDSFLFVFVFVVAFTTDVVDYLVALSLATGWGYLILKLLAFILDAFTYALIFALSRAMEKRVWAARRVARIVVKRIIAPMLVESVPLLGEVLPTNTLVVLWLLRAARKRAKKAREAFSRLEEGKMSEEDVRNYSY